MRSSPLLLIAALLAGCSSDPPTFVDAPVVQPIDAATDGARGPATITVNREGNEPGTGEPIEDLQVFFIRPDGTYEIVMTGADGRASAEVVPGSAIVTAHQRTFSGVASYFLTAFAGVGPGFDVIAGGKARSSAGLGGSVTFTWAPVVGAVRYQAVASCGYGFPKGTSAAIEVEEGCAAATSATVLVTAYDDVGPIAYSVQPSFNLTAALGTSVAMPAFTTALSTVSVAYTGLPAAIDRIEPTLELQKDGRVYGNVDGSLTATPPNQMVTAPIVPVGTSTAIRTRFRAAGGKALPIYHLRHYAGQQLTHTLDVGAGILPSITFPTLDVSTRTITWLSGAGAGSADTLVSRGYWDTTAGGSVEFSLVGPAIPGVTSAVLPVLPAELADLTPSATGSGFMNEIWMIDVVGKDYPAVATDVLPESENLYFELSVFADEPEVWFTGTLPL